MNEYTKITEISKTIKKGIDLINAKSRSELFATMRKVGLKASTRDSNRDMIDKLVNHLKLRGKALTNKVIKELSVVAPVWPQISDKDLESVFEELELIPRRRFHPGPVLRVSQPDEDEIEYVRGSRGQITILNPEEHSVADIQNFLHRHNISGQQRLGMFSVSEANTYTPMKVNTRSVNVDNISNLRRAIDVGKNASSGRQYPGSLGMTFGGSGGSGVSYPPVFKGDVNCAMKVYRKYVPGGKNGVAVGKYFDSINVEGGFTEDVARAINVKYGYGCTMFDQLGKAAFNIESRNKMRHIMLQAFDQHVYEFKHHITDKYYPTHVIIPSNLRSWYELAIEICEEGPQFIYRTNINTMQQQLVGLKTANAEYKRADRPLKEFDDIDRIYNSLRRRYPHNFATRNPTELEYLQLADHHVATIWYDRPQKGYEIDFNQAYRAAAELTLVPEYANTYQFPHYPVWWKKVTADHQNEALEQIITYSGFAHLENLNFDIVPEPLRGYIAKQCAGRKVFCSPEIDYFVEIGVTFDICSMAYNQMRQTIDWQFSESADISATANKNINRIVMGRIIAKYNKSSATRACDKRLTPYYQSALGDSVIQVDSSAANVDLIRYWRDGEEVHDQQYHIHAYILCYLRMAMWRLLADIKPDNIIKINIDAVHVKTPIDLKSFEIDNSPLGRLGCVKMAQKTTRGELFEAEPQMQMVPDVHMPDPIEDTPQFLLLGGIAGAGKTEEMIAQPALGCIAAFSNKLANSLRDRAPEASAQTMHTKYGVEFADPELKVTKVPADHLHNLDDVLLAPARLVENIVRKLHSMGKRISITYGPGQATMNRPLAEDLIHKTLPALGFKEKMLMNSRRMDSELAKIAESYRQDKRISEVIEVDRLLAICSRKLAAAIAAEEENPDAADEVNELKRTKWQLIRHKRKIISKLVAEYMTHFKSINTKDAINRYLADPIKHIFVTATNKRREEINDIITKSHKPSVKKFRYLTLVNRKVNGQKYRRYRSEIVAVTPAELAADAQLAIDIKRGYCEEMHIYTVHSCQGETVEHDILIDLDALFDPDILYSALTRVRNMSNVFLFSDETEREKIVIDDPDVNAFLAECEVPQPKSRKGIDLVVNENTPNWPPHSFDKLDDVPQDGRLIIHTEFPHRHFLAFHSREHFAAWSKDQPEDQRCYHEVVQTDLRKVVIDFDWNDYNEDGGRGQNQLRRGLRDTFIKLFKTVFFEEIDRDDIVLIESSGKSKIKGTYKFSLQIRTINHIATRASCKKFARAFAKSAAEYGKYVDLGVYKRIQNFRVPGSTKLGDDRHSEILFGGTADTWVANITGDNIIKLPNIAPEAQKESPIKPIGKIDNILEQKIVAAAAQYTDGLEYKGSGRYQRVRKSFCDMCEREHEADNMFISIVGRGEYIPGAVDCTVRLYCYGGEDGVRPDRAIDLFDIAVSDITQTCPIPIRQKRDLKFTDSV